MPINLNINPLSPIPMTVSANDQVSMTAEEARIIHAVSPKVEMTEITGGTELKITDIDGAHTTDIMNGADGQDGQDGVSPTASVSKSGSTATITITDANGTTTAEVSDGQDGTDGQDGQDGADGASAYVWIKWSATEPTQDSDMKSTADKWIGIYSGDSSTAPTTYTSYTWYQYKGDTGAAGQDGQDGQDGTDGTSAYVWIKYSTAQPTQDSDMKDTADAWMGIYSGSASSAPTTYTSYTWYQIKGATGATGQTGPTGPGVPNGGTTGQILMKNSNTDQDTKWANAPTQSSMRKVTFAIGVSDWTGSGSSFSAEVTTAYVTASSIEEVFMDSSVLTYAQNISSLSAEKKTGGGGVIFTASAKPTGTISGHLLVWDNDDGKLPVIIEDTTVAIANGGTGQSTLAGAKSVLGITELADQVATKSKICHCAKDVTFTNGSASISFTKDVYLIAVNSVASATKISFSRTAGNTGYNLKINESTASATINIEFWYAVGITNESPAPIS